MSGLDGVLVAKLAEVTTSWGVNVTVTTDSDGNFSVTRNCPGVGGTYVITATFKGDASFTGSSIGIQNYQVAPTIETTLTLAYFKTSSDMGLPSKFYGYLKEKVSGKAVAGKTIKLTILGGGVAWTYTITANKQGYYEFTNTNNGGSFTWAEARFLGDATFLASYSGRVYG